MYKHLINCFSPTWQLLVTQEAVGALRTSSSVRTVCVWARAGCVMASMTAGTALTNSSVYAVRNVLFIACGKVLWKVFCLYFSLCYQHNHSCLTNERFWEDLFICLIRRQVKANRFSFLSSWNTIKCPKNLDENSSATASWLNLPHNYVNKDVERRQLTTWIKVAVCF